MTNESAIQPCRSPYEVARKLEAERYHLGVLRDLMGEYAALDFRPIIWDGEHITYTRELAIPDELKKQYRETAERVAELECELMRINCHTIP